MSRTWDIIDSNKHVTILGNQRMTNFLLQMIKLSQDKIGSYLMKNICAIVNWELWSEGTLFLKVNAFFWSYDIFEINVIVLKKEK